MTERTDYRARTSTQARHPWRAAGRTFVQVYVPLLVVVVLGLPALIEVVDETAGDYLPDRFRSWLLGASTVASVLALLGARLMALPAMTRIVEHVKGLRWLAPEPPTTTRRADPVDDYRRPVAEDLPDA